MTGAYAIGSPWWKVVGGHCGESADLGGWLAAMTGRRHHAGPPPWAMFGGPPPWAGMRGPGWRAPKARRGDVRAAILAVLAEQALNGYQIIAEIAERSGGSWKPSPGSIYPTLQQLEDEGLVIADAESGRRAYTLTDEGRAYVANHAEELASPWPSPGDPDGSADLKPLIGQIAAAVWQIVAVGTPDQQEKGRQALVELRRRLYAILADDEPDDTDDQRGSA